MNIDNSNHLPVGFELGDFSVVSVAGEGGFSVVYVANDNLLDRKVAIKEYLPTSVAARGRDLVTVLPRSSSTVDGFQAGLRSFVREARLLAQFSHPAIVEVYRVWEQNGTAYIAMRFLKGGTLSHQIQNGRVFAEDELRTILEPILDAIELLHSQNIIHRDVSPDNIILAEGQPVLLDLGAARAVVAGITQALTSVLKPGYAPIEQYADDGSLKQGTWTDVYAIAGVLYKLATGVTPVQAIGRVVADPLQSMQSLGGNFSAAFAESVMAGLAVFPDNRIKSVSELRNRLGWSVVSAQHVTTTLATEKDNDRTVVVPGALTDASLRGFSNGEPIHPSATQSATPHELVHVEATAAKVDPGNRRSGKVNERRWYRALASLALVAILFGAYRVWLIASNSAASSSDSAQKSTTTVVPVGNSASLTVEKQASQSLPLTAPSRAPALPYSVDVAGNTEKAGSLTSSPIKLPPTVQAEAVAPNAQNNRSAAQASAAISSPYSPSALASKAELVQLGAVGRKYLPGEKIELALKTDGAGHAYCFWLDEAKQVIRIHPNRFNRSALVSADKSLALPGTTEFSLVAERRGADQSVECHVVANDMLSKLPANVARTDLTVLSVRSLDEVRNTFASAVGNGNLLLTARYVVRVEAR